MSSACSVCGRTADRFRDVVRVVGMRVEVVCRACANQKAASARAVTVQPNDVAPSTPANVPGATTQPPITAVLPRDLRRGQRSEGLALAVLVSVGVVAAGVAFVVRARRARPPVLVQTAPTPNPPRAARVAASTGSEDSDFDVPPPAGLEALLQGGWTHPLPGPFRDLPTHEQRRFGAYRGREHYRNRYCGSGHCGVDLGYNVGLPVLAARDGTLERVARNPTDVEGKYLKIQHPGALRTYYMHLDEIAPELSEGVAVRAGQIIGTLGRTGIKIAEPHLHFMISFEANGKELFVDPEPLMARANLVEVDRLPAWTKR